MLLAEYRICEIVPGAPLLRVRGEIDEHGTGAFREALGRVERLAKSGAIVDLGAAALCSAVAYSNVIAAAARLAAAGCGPLIAVCASDSLASRVFGILGFEDRCSETVVAAISALRCEGASLAVTYAESFLRATVS